MDSVIDTILNNGLKTMMLRVIFFGKIEYDIHRSLFFEQNFHGGFLWGRGVSSPQQETI